MQAQEYVYQIFDKIITIGGGLWVVMWLKDVIRETFKKIDDIERRITKIEHRQEFEREHKGK